MEAAKSAIKVPENKLAHAILWATLNHGGQLDKGGQPYILHPLSVMFRVRRAGQGEAVQIIAVLHDTLEDTDLTLEEVRVAFGEAIAASVNALTRRSGETYHQYLCRVKEDPNALIVKLADLQENLDPQRHLWANDSEAEAELNRLTKRYVRALQFLSPMVWKNPVT